ncbi:MAG: TlyA family RNA methyltransferase [Anaerolineales bacterium]|nr:MAG: TlyA family RNA methyltransferase [Anaerolineales bacterium]
MSDKIRLDHLLVRRGLAENGSQARALVLARHVRVNGQVAPKPGAKVPADAEVTLQQPLPYVSRGGFKLAAALDAFRVSARGAVCADVGASTGGFTDCLLQHGAARVYAIDVGYGQLAWKLRQDERVVLMERTNARYLESLPEPVGIATLDVSFISLRLLFPAVVGWLAAGADVISLVKPQFEAERRQVGKGGVVRDPAVHRRVLQKTAGYALGHDLAVCGIIRSPITGPAGNSEFLMHLRQGPPADDFDLSVVIGLCLADVEG